MPAVIFTPRRDLSCLFTKAYYGTITVMVLKFSSPGWVTQPILSAISPNFAVGNLNQRDVETLKCGSAIRLGHMPQLQGISPLRQKIRYNCVYSAYSQERIAAGHSG
jgi:hypothetical protein